MHDPLDETAAAALESQPGDDLSQLERERDEIKDLLLRTSAEFDNYRKRTERDSGASPGARGRRSSSTMIQAPPRRTTGRGRAR